MKRGRGLFVTALGIGLLPGSVAFADQGPRAGGSRAGGDRPPAVKIFTLDPSTHGNPEGVAAKPGGGVFFVGATGDGTIYRGTIDSPKASEFIPGAAGKSAVGMKIAGDKLYVAGGATGKISVYNLSTKLLVASFATGAGGFLNDLVVTRKGDVFVTDSYRPMLWHVTGAQVRVGTGTPQGIPMGPEIAFQTGFNLNGIVARDGGRQLVVVQTNTGKLFRIDLDHSAPSGRAIHQIQVTPLPGGDGMLLDGERLVVVRGGPPMLTLVKLSHGAERGVVVGTRTDPSLRGPSTVARARNLYLVVNADFATNTKPFTVSGLPARKNGD